MEPSSGANITLFVRRMEKDALEVTYVQAAKGLMDSTFHGGAACNNGKGRPMLARKTNSYEEANPNTR